LSRAHRGQNVATHWWGAIDRLLRDKYVNCSPDLWHIINGFLHSQMRRDSQIDCQHSKRTWPENTHSSVSHWEWQILASRCYKMFYSST
jgi:hypothetical protein